MIWNDHRLIDVGNRIALAAMVDLITVVGAAFGISGCGRPGRSVAAVAIVATAPRLDFGGRVGEQPSHVVEPSSLFGLRCRIKEVDPIVARRAADRALARGDGGSILRRTAACSSRRRGPPCRFSSISNRPVRRSNSCQCNHFDCDGGGLAVQDALHDAVALRFSHSADDRKEQLRNAVPCHVSAKMVRANETPERHSPGLEAHKGKLALLVVGT